MTVPSTEFLPSSALGRGLGDLCWGPLATACASSSFIWTVFLEKPNQQKGELISEPGIPRWQRRWEGVPLWKRLCSFSFPKLEVEKGGFANMLVGASVRIFRSR